MENIICDICGTQYPETDSECPLCGCVKNDAVHTPGSEGQADTFVKGGRFSKSNVRKRMNEGATPVRRKVQHEIPEDFDDEEDELPQSNWGLIIIVILLLLAIIAVSTYIAVYFMGKGGSDGNGSGSSSTTTVPIQRVPCTDIDFTVQKVVLNSKDSTYQLVYSLFPVETTDKPVFVAKDPAIAEVDKNTGLIRAVAPGSTVITVTCGDEVVQISVECQFGGITINPSTKPSTNPTQPTTPVDEVLKLNRTDFTLSGAGRYWNLYSGNIDKTQITWTSSDESVVTVENGKVVAVGNGSATVTARYHDQIATCKVYVNGVVATQPTTPIPENEVLKLNRDDFTLSGSGSKWNLYSGKLDPKDITWTSKNPAVAAVNNGMVTAVGNGDTEIVAEYKGQTVTCIVRVRGF